MDHPYALYYHPIPFRGHFVRYVLALAGQGWEEPPHEEVMRLKTLPVDAQPVPFMAPPLLHDRRADVWLAQLPAILTYLGAKHGVMPDDPARVALTHKIIGDASDVLEEITCNCGAQMWTQAAWDVFAADRLPHWMAIFEDTGRRHGVSQTGGFILGGDEPMLADLVTAALWHTMFDRLAPLRTLLEPHGPAIAALADRIAALPAIAAMRLAQDARMAGLYCGGQIETSLRSVIATG
jgi:glutathione S-transferase